MKVSILAWRLLRDRFPTKSNLHNRGIIPDEATYCVAGCGLAETAHHLFLHCVTFGSIWQQVRAWLGFSGVHHHNLGAHFLQFTYSLGGKKTMRSFLQLIWLLCVWLIWKERNNRIFNDFFTPIPEIVEKVKFHSYW